MGNGNTGIVHSNTSLLAVEGTLPQVTVTSDEIDEERRLLYVGITRAREQLMLSCSASRTPGGRANRRPSRFLKDLLLTR